MSRCLKRKLGTCLGLLWIFRLSQMFLVGEYGAKYVTEALVQWKDMPPEDVTWEELECLRQ